LRRKAFALLGKKYRRKESRGGGASQSRASKKSGNRVFFLCGIRLRYEGKEGWGEEQCGPSSLENETGGESFLSSRWGGGGGGNAWAGWGGSAKTEATLDKEGKGKVDITKDWRDVPVGQVNYNAS